MTACASSARGAGPVHVLGGVRMRRARLSDEARGPGIIAAMKFLRMSPGYGELLIAEGDPEVVADEQRLIEEFRRQLDAGHVGRCAHRARHGPARGGDGAGFEEIPRDAGRVIFFPAPRAARASAMRPGRGERT